MSTGTQLTNARALLARWNRGPLEIKTVDVGDEDRELKAWELSRWGESLGTFSRYGNAVKAMNKHNR